MGRKKLPNARKIKVTVRFNDYEYNTLQKAFEESYVGLNNVSEFIRYLVFKSEELIKKTDETKEIQKNAVENKDWKKYFAKEEDNEEWEDNVTCMGAPIYDYRGIIIAAVSTAWHLNATREINLPNEEIAALVIQTANEISRRMGFRRR